MNCDCKKEIERLKAKLERTKEHAQRRREEEEKVNQAVYDELYDENMRLKSEMGLVVSDAGKGLLRRIAKLEKVVRMASEASHESGCLGTWNNNECDCVVSAARAALEEK